MNWELILTSVVRQDKRDELGRIMVALLKSLRISLLLEPKKHENCTIHTLFPQIWLSAGLDFYEPVCYDTFLR